MSIPERIRYGATELRRFYNRNLFLALIVSVIVHLALIGLYLTSTGEAAATQDESPRDRGVTEIWDKLPEPPKTDRKFTDDEGSGPNTPAAPPVVPSQPKFSIEDAGPRAGEAIAVPDSLLTPDDGKFANLENIGAASPDGKGDSGGMNSTAPNGPREPAQGGGGGGRADATPKEEIISDYVDPNVELPDVDLAEISGRVKYPEMARSNGIEGRVTVKVLIDVDGRPMRTSIEMGAASVLDSAAIQAVRGTVFKPATVNGQPVRAWLFVPVDFKLD